MAEETAPGAMNLDLNLGPLDNSSDDGEPGLRSYDEGVSLEDWLDGNGQRFREAVRRSQRWRSLLRQVQIPPETRNLALEFIGGSGLQTGEGSVAAEERPIEDTKACDNGTGNLDDKASGKDDSGKGNSDDGNFFDCNICLDLSKDPVLTCCGHLFCWPCLYRWLHVHSDAKECPVCKGEVTTKNITPIYGRGDSTREPEEDSGLKVPPRPQARRVESWRQAIQRATWALPFEEMFRRLGTSFDLDRGLVQLQSQNPGGSRDSPERTESLLNRFLTSRGMRTERTPATPSNEVIDLTESSPASEVRESRRPSAQLLRRTHFHRVATLTNLTSAISSPERLAAERLVESYFHNTPVDRNQEQPLPVDDRDSVSSIAAVIHSESQTVDNAVEIDSTVSLSTSSSRRRNDSSRISDVDSGDSRAPRRRRLN